LLFRSRFPTKAALGHIIGSMSPMESQNVFTTLVQLEDVDSTNKELRRRFDENTSEFFAVTALHQTSGLGRLGRTWVTESAKSMALSILLKPQSQSQIDWITIMTGLAVRSCLSDHGVSAKIKWPNDVLVSGKKISGILAELIDTNSVIIGIGLNLDPQDGSPDTAVSLSELGVSIALPDLIQAVGKSIRDYWQKLAADPKAAIAEFQMELKEHCSTLGSEVRAELPGGKNIYGLATAIDQEGKLVVECPEPVVLAAADVWHLRN